MSNKMFYSLIVVLFLVFKTSFSETCPGGWTQLGNHCFSFMDRMVTYDEANTLCRSLDSEVVTIRSNFQNQLVVDFMYHTLAKHVNIWLGARKLIHTAKYDQWVWSDFTQVNYFNWAPNQPNANGPQYCLHMVRQHKVNYEWPAGTWNDIKCSEKNAVLCQRKVEVAGLNIPFVLISTQQFIYLILILILVPVFGYFIINCLSQIKFKETLVIFVNRLLGQLRTKPYQSISSVI